MEVKLLQKTTNIYRSYSDDSKREGYWFALNMNDVLGYGNKTGIYNTVRDLKLINIAHPDFYTFLKETMKSLLPNNPTLLENGHSILFPLGFDDIVYYRELASDAGVNPASYALKPAVHTESILSFNGRSRLSLIACDVELMAYLKMICGSMYDGIISERQFPDIIRNGFHFPEISIFDKSLVNFVSEVVRPVVGGSTNTDFLPPIKFEEMTPKFQETIRRTAAMIENLDLTNFKFPNYTVHESYVTNNTEINALKNVSIARKTRRNRRR